MATEANVAVFDGVFVQRCTRGFKRTFLQLSIPNGWMDQLLEVPLREDRMCVAMKFDKGLQLLLEEAVKGKGE